MEKKRKRIKIYSALEVANICGVVNQTAINWIKNGSLKAFTTPGGQYRVYAEHLVDFLKERGMKVPSQVLESLNDGFVNEKKILIIDPDRVAIKELRESLADSLPGYSVFLRYLRERTVIYICFLKDGFLFVCQKLPVKVK